MESLKGVIKCNDLIIIGAGGIGRETAYIIEEINEINKTWNILGFVDDNSEMWGQCLNGYYVLGGFEYLKSLDKKPHIVIAMGNCRLKRNIVEDLKGDFKFATIVHPTVKISKYVNVGHGTIIYESVVLTVNTAIGNHVIISGNCGIGHDSVIGDYSSILWGARLCGYDALGQEVFLGVGVKIIQGIQINDGVKIDAGVTITSNL